MPETSHNAQTRKARYDAGLAERRMSVARATPRRRAFFSARTWLFCLSLLPGLPTTAHASPPVKLAVFEFELEDFSAGAAATNGGAADAATLGQVTEVARRLIAQSGRYSLVDVSGADAEPAKAHWLWKCNGCDAGIAQKLGADQSFVGIVTRISRAEYTMMFQIRDACTGDVIDVERTDLRMGAANSWSRGAASLIKNRLLERQDQP